MSQSSYVSSNDPLTAIFGLGKESSAARGSTLALGRRRAIQISARQPARHFARRRWSCQGTPIQFADLAHCFLSDVRSVSLGALPDGLFSSVEVLSGSLNVLSLQHGLKLLRILVLGLNPERLRRKHRALSANADSLASVAADLGPWLARTQIFLIASRNICSASASSPSCP